ncbi:hypothetical protein ACFQGT_11200 [Natrialbaceae archaeon GCM10025810]|uniref:hypothetical protein n=1 Tax=Halovalidus salilacus TaxID=3075124 RepID=UPI0036086BB0
MATHAPQDRECGGVPLPDSVPFELPRSSRLSWDLGTRVIDDGESTLQSEWAHSKTGRTISVFRVTGNTVVVRVRTPVGRERFYGAARNGLGTAITALEESPNWRRTE